MPPAAQSSALRLGLIPGAATTRLTSTGTQEEAKGTLRPVRKFPTTFSCQAEGLAPCHLPHLERAHLAPLAGMQRRHPRTHSLALWQVLALSAAGPDQPNGWWVALLIH